MGNLHVPVPRNGHSDLAMDFIRPDSPNPGRLVQFDWRWGTVYQPRYALERMANPLAEHHPLGGIGRDRRISEPNRFFFRCLERLYGRYPAQYPDANCFPGEYVSIAETKGCVVIWRFCRSSLLQRSNALYNSHRAGEHLVFKMTSIRDGSPCADPCILEGYSRLQHYG